MVVERLAAVVGPAAMADGPGASGDLVVRVRAERADGDGDADVVLDLHDPSWPLIRHVAPGLDAPEAWYVTESRAFFGARAATWDTRFGDDLPAYAAAVAEAGRPARPHAARRRTAQPRSAVATRLDAPPEVSLATG